MANPNELNTHYRAIASFLETIGMEKKLVDIYMLGLRKGKITTREVADNIKEISQSSATKHLRSLSTEGFFIYSPSHGETGVGGQNRGIAYYVIPPGIALKSYVDIILGKKKEITESIGKIDEHIELIEGEEDTEYIFIIEKDDTSVNILADAIRNSTSNIKIYSRDCSWCKIPEIRDSIKEIAKKIPVNVIATNPDEQKIKSLKEMKVKLKQSAVPAPPFFIIDNLLFLPHKAGPFSRYQMLKITNKYLSGYLNDLFDWILEN